MVYWKQVDNIALLIIDYRSADSETVILRDLQEADKQARLAKGGSGIIITAPKRSTDTLRKFGRNLLKRLEQDNVPVHCVAMVGAYSPMLREVFKLLFSTFKIDFRVFESYEDAETWVVCCSKSKQGAGA